MLLVGTPLRMQLGLRGDLIFGNERRQSSQTQSDWDSLLVYCLNHYVPRIGRGIQ